MSNEHPKQPESEGLIWLRRIGREDYAERLTTLKDGSSLRGEDFLDVCRVHAMPVLQELDELEAENPEGFADDPDYIETVEVAQSFFDSYFGDKK
jgi:hypothetical protein